MKGLMWVAVVGMSTGCAEFWRTHFPPRPDYDAPGPVVPGPTPDRPNPQPEPGPQPEPAPPPPQPDPRPEPSPQPTPKYPVAQAVPGRPGFVFSPYNNKLVDVTGMASGTLVADPHFPASEKKHFRVP